MRTSIITLFAQMSRKEILKMISILMYIYTSFIFSVHAMFLFILVYNVLTVHLSDVHDQVADAS